MTTYLFTVMCPICGTIAVTRSQSRFTCASCKTKLTPDEIIFVKMDRIVQYEDASGTVS
jgi:hypothetical protein